MEKKSDQGNKTIIQVLSNLATANHISKPEEESVMVHGESSSSVISEDLRAERACSFRFIYSENDGDLLADRVGESRVVLLSDASRGIANDTYLWFVPASRPESISSLE